MIVIIIITILIMIIIIIILPLLGLFFNKSGFSRSEEIQDV